MLKSAARIENQHLRLSQDVVDATLTAFGSETNSALRDLLRAKRLLGEMIDNVATSVDADVSEQRNELSRLLNGHSGRDQPK